MRRLNCIWIILLVLQSALTETMADECTIYDVALSDMTKAIVSQYITETQATTRADKVVLTTLMLDTAHWALQLYADRESEYPTDYGDTFLGACTYCKMPIKCYGEANDLFLRVLDSSHIVSCVAMIPFEYDPDYWQVCVHTDTTFCRYRSWKHSMTDNIASLDSIAAIYLRPSTDKEEIYAPDQYDISTRVQLPASVDSVHRLLGSSSFLAVPYGVRYNRSDSVWQLYGSARIAVNHNGLAYDFQWTTKPNSERLHTQATAYLAQLCTLPFVPLRVHGDAVDSYLDVRLYYNRLYFKDTVSE